MTTFEQRYDAVMELVRLYGARKFDIACAIRNGGFGAAESDEAMALYSRIGEAVMNVCLDAESQMKPKEPDWVRQLRACPEVQGHTFNPERSPCGPCE